MLPGWQPLEVGNVSNVSVQFSNLGEFVLRRLAYTHYRVVQFDDNLF